MTIQDILNEWAEYSNYDPDQRSFNLLSSEYEMHKAGKLAEAALEKYDKSGALSVLILKSSYLKCLKSTRVKLIDVFANPKCLENEKRFYEVMNSDTVKTVEDAITATLGRMYSEVIDEPLVIDAESDDKDNKMVLVDRLSKVLSDIEGLHLDVYMCDNTPLKVTRYNKELHVFNTLAEAVLKMSAQADGVYVGYINVACTSDSYFNVFIKSNGTLIGLNDRIDERYPGQHFNLNKRNGRWADNKGDNIFPYDTLLSYSDYCSKGYAMTFRVKDNFNDAKNIPFKMLDAEHGYDNLVLGLYLISLRYNDKLLNNPEITYVSTLHPQLLDNIFVRNALVPVDSSNNTAVTSLIESHSNIIRAGSYSAEDVVNNNVPDEWKEVFQNTTLSTLYSTEFTIEDTDEADLSNLNNLIASKDTAIVPEYTGSIDRVNMGEYYRLRKQLAIHIKKEMQKELDELGGSEKVRFWFESCCRKNLANILDMCARQWLEDVESGSHVGVNCKNDENKMRIPIFENSMIDSSYYISWKHMLNPIGTRRRNGKDEEFLMCPITGKPVNIYFIIDPLDYDQVQLCIGDVDKNSVPKIIKCFSKNYAYHGNSLLSMVDPVREVENAFAKDSKLTTAIGLSKSGLNKILKAYK